MNVKSASTGRGVDAQGSNLQSDKQSPLSHEQVAQKASKWTQLVLHCAQRAFMRHPPTSPLLKHKLKQDPRGATPEGEQVPVIGAHATLATRFPVVPRVFPALPVLCCFLVASLSLPVQASPSCCFMFRVNEEGYRSLTR